MGLLTITVWGCLSFKNTKYITIVNSLMSRSCDSGFFDLDKWCKTLQEFCWWQNLFWISLTSSDLCTLFFNNFILWGIAESAYILQSFRLIWYLSQWLVFIWGGHSVGHGQGHGRGGQGEGGQWRRLLRKEVFGEELHQVHKVCVKLIFNSQLSSYHLSSLSL